MAQDARDHKGTYLLMAQLGREVQIEVGKLGTYRFAPGWYAYAGSALGPGGLPARLARHARSDKRLHWHVDYLLQHATLQAVWRAIDPGRLECAWAAAIRALPGAQTPVRRFGASDCRCPAHLVFLPERPSDAQIAAALSERSPPEATVRRATAG